MSAILKIRRGDDWENLATLSTPVVTIGRTSGNDVCVENDTVSRQHLRIIRVENLFYCIDLNSTNGTLVNEVQLDPFYPYQLFSGDILILGTAPIKFIDQLGEYRSNYASLLSIDFAPKKVLPFTGSLRVNDPSLPHFEVTELDACFVVTISEGFRILLNSSSQILSQNSFKISNPGCLRIDDLFLVLSGPREETQVTTEAKLPVLLESELAKLSQSRKDQGTIVIQHIDPHSRGFLRRSDYLPKVVFEPSNIFTIELVLWVIIVMSIAITGMLLLWYFS